MHDKVQLRQPPEWTVVKSGHYAQLRNDLENALRAFLKLLDETESRVTHCDARFSGTSSYPHPQTQSNFS